MERTALYLGLDARAGVAGFGIPRGPPRRVEFEVQRELNLLSAAAPVRPRTVLTELPSPGLSGVLGRGPKGLRNPGASVPIHRNTVTWSPTGDAPPRPETSRPGPPGAASVHGTPALLWPRGITRGT